MRCALVLPILLSAIPARAGVIIEGRNVFNGQASETRMLLQGDRLRIERRETEATAGVPARTPTVTLFDGTRVIHLDSVAQTYTAFTLAQLEAQFARMEQMLGKLPPEARAQLEGPAKLGPMKFTRSTGGDQVAGIACDNYALAGGFSPGGKACLARWSAATVRAEDLAPLQKMLEAIKSLSKLLAPSDLPYEGMNTWPGWPLTLHDAAGKEIHRTTKVTRSEIPPSQFEIPPGYSEKPLPSFLGGRAGGAPPSAP